VPKIKLTTSSFERTINIHVVSYDINQLRQYYDDVTLRCRACIDCARSLKLNERLAIKRDVAYQHIADISEPLMGYIYKLRYVEMYPACTAARLETLV